jgi:hypothetical protein
MLLARAAWLALVVIQLVSFALFLPKYLPLAEHPCPENCTLTTENARALTHAGIAPAAYLSALLIVIVFSTLIATTMAVILVIRRPRDRMALITAAFVVILPTSVLINTPPVAVGFSQTTAFQLPLPLDLALAALQSGIIYGLFFLFPTGRFVPRWSWLLLAGFLIFTTAIGVWPNLQATSLAAWPIFFGGAIACMGYRYWRVSTALERQQTKWVLLGFLTFLLASQAYWLPSFTPLQATVYIPLAYLAYQLVMPIMLMTFFIAIQRYRLYDIDAIVRRTLLYGLLTGILVALYLLGVVGTQAIVQALSGHATGESPLAIVATTLVIAALFQPLRRHLQRVIDRHFFRGKYDLQRTVAAFGAALRSGEEDIDHLSDRLVRVVEETVQPTYVSLWLRESAHPLQRDDAL